MENSSSNNPLRFLRPWEKRRGDRSTGSRLVGRVGEAIFFGALFLLGLIPASVLLVSQIVAPHPEWYQIGFGYYLVLLVLLSFLFTGGAGLVFALLEMGASPERRSAIARAASGLELLEDPRSRQFPTLPRVADGLNPGVKLAYRLASDQSHSWRLVTSAILSIMWCVVAAGLIVSAVEAHRANSPQWMLTVFSFPFLGVALWTVFYFFRHWMLATGIGPTIVEVSDSPLAPGRRYTICVNQSGRLTMRSLECWLVCEEQATYRQGTDIRIETREVFRRRIFRRHNLRIDPGMPFQLEYPLEIPAGVTHSFVADNNAVLWKVSILGEAESWPPFERSFPLVMYPENAPTPSPKAVAVQERAER